MIGMEKGSDDLEFAVSGNRIFLRVTGRGSFKISATMKQFLSQISPQYPGADVIIDLAECIGMDSTFMGVLAGLSGRLKKAGRSLELINLSEKNARLLSTLGVDQVIAHYSHSHGHQMDRETTRPLPVEEASKKEMAETALQAHENLVQINDENRPRFQRVIEYLKSDVDRLNG